MTDLFCSFCEKNLAQLRVALTYQNVSPAHDRDLINVCEDCQWLYELNENAAFLLIGQSICESDGWRWQNRFPLRYHHSHIVYSQLPFLDPKKHATFLEGHAVDTKQLPLQQFPLVRDFTVNFLIASMALFSSHSLGFLTRFELGYQQQDPMQANFVPPSGDFRMPYYDFDQSWEALVVAGEHFVYILTGDWEQEKNYTIWFKVEKDCYEKQWKQALEMYRAQHAGETTPR